MAENPIKTPDAPVDPSTEETEPTRLQVFVNKHPRAAKIVAITGAVTAVIGASHVTRTVSARRHHIVQAGDHAKEALDELSASVSPTDSEA